MLYVSFIWQIHLLPNFWFCCTRKDFHHYILYFKSVECNEMHPHVCSVSFAFLPFLLLVTGIITFFWEEGRGFLMVIIWKRWCELLQCSCVIAYFCLLLEVHCLRYLLYFFGKWTSGFWISSHKASISMAKNHHHTGSFWIPAEL